MNLNLFKQNGTCKYNDSNVQSRIVSYSPVGQWNETALKIAVAKKGPVTVAICATCPTFYNYGLFLVILFCNSLYGVKTAFFSTYRSGIYEDPTCNCSVNHGVVVVGYGTSLGTDYWM